MRTTTTTLSPSPAESETHRCSLSAFLSTFTAGGTCFCCASSTDLLVDEDGMVLVRCPRCGAEISEPEVTRPEATDRHSWPA
jgi:predicted amidophosphoribosyltransferase